MLPKASLRLATLTPGGIVAIEHNFFPLTCAYLATPDKYLKTKQIDLVAGHDASRSVNFARITRTTANGWGRPRLS
jgi:hypothetical protein